VAAWDGGSWAALGTGTQQFVAALTPHQDHLIAGTQDWFQCVCDCTSEGLCDEVPACLCGIASVASWDGASWSTLGEWDGAFGGFAHHDEHLIMLTGSSYEGSIRAWDGSAWTSLHNPSWPVVGGATIYDGLLVVGVEIPLFVWGNIILIPQIVAWDGTSWSYPFDYPSGQVWALTVYDGKLIVGGDFTMIGGVQANYIAAWDGQVWSPLGSGTDAPVHRLAVYDGSLVVTGDFTMAGGKSSPSLAVWTKHDPRQVALDVLPGSCSNPVPATRIGRGPAILPVAILGSADLDVSEIDPASVKLHGVGPIRWSYEDVDTPADVSGACACPAARADGRGDLTLAFDRNAVLAGLPGQDGDVLVVEGQLHDGTAFQGSDCVTFVGRRQLESWPTDRVVRRAATPAPQPTSARLAPAQ